MGKGKSWGKAERFMIPTLPICMAVFCCVLNFIIPGLGTIVAAFASLCCNHNRDMDEVEMCCSCCVNILFGILQLVLAVLIIGWIWSGFWGFCMVVLSLEYYHKDQRVPVIAPRPMATTYVTQTVTNVPPQPGYPVQPVMQQQAYIQPAGYAPGYAQPGYVQPGVVYVAPQQGMVQAGHAPPTYPNLQPAPQASITPVNINITTSGMPPGTHFQQKW